jgi:hypothetical protein
MTFTAILDVAIGLIFVYLLLGLLATALQEAVAALLQWRGQELRRALVSLLRLPSDDSLFHRVFGHALVHPEADRRLPSYVAAENFSVALTDALLNGTNAPLFSQVENTVAALPAGPAKQALSALITQAAGDYAVFKTEVERWFNNAMDRVSGSYKRRSQIFAIVFGIIVAIGFNVDSINIASTLWLDPQKRELVAQQAQAYVDSGKAPASADAAVAPPTLQQAQEHGTAAIQAIELLPLPLGWNYLKKPDESWGHTLSREVFGSFGTFLTKLIGLLATGLAVSLGAPFWFDTLRKFLNIRSAGPRPEKKEAA